MKRSVSVRLFIGISGFMILFVVIALFLNSSYLGPYYQYRKKKVLLGSSEEINKIYNGNPYEISLELEKMERERGLQIIVFNEYGMIYNSSMNRFGGQNLIRKPDPLLHLLRMKRQRITGEKTIFETIQDPRLNTRFLTLITQLNNKDVLILSIPLTAIHESAEIANHFFFYTGMVMIILGSILAYLFSKRFSKPILELNDIAQHMAKLDFSKKYNITTEDEIGELGKSINSLSEQLNCAINELKEKNQKLIEDIERERKIDEMRKEFVSSVSHELKTPISLIQGYAEGLKVNVLDDEENKNFYCDVIIDEALKMNKLVKDLLNLSQIESGYFQLERSTFDIIDLIEEVLEKYSPILKKKGIQLNVEVKNDFISHVYADRIRMEQVLTNYLNNAINHVDERKSIIISVRRVNEKIRVSVFNSGKTIPEQEHEHIWKSFYKIDKARTRAYGGTGLGLSIVRAIQELHHNRYGVQNREDGVEFWFEL